MNAHPRHVKGPIWELPLTLTEEDTVREIPGLQVGNGVARGWPDAIQAAVYRLGGKWALTGAADFEAKLLKKEADVLLSSDLRNYQKSGILKLHTLLKTYGGALLADDMGLGKTRQVIELAKILGGKTVVVCQASQRETWRDEVKKWWPEASIYVMEPGHRTPTYETNFLVVPSADFAKENYEPPFYATLLVLEEAHQLRGRTTKRGKALQTYAPMCLYRLLVTGTPNYNLPRDLWLPLSLALGGAFGSGFQFNLAYCAAKLNAHGAWEAKGISNAEELQRRLNHYMVRRTKAEVADELPSITRQVVWVPEQRTASEAFKRCVLQKSTKLRQRAIEATLKGKYEVCTEIAVKAGRSLTLTWRHEDVDKLAELYTKAGLAVRPLTGGHTPKKRQAVVKEATSSGASIVATIDSIGTGVNMQGVASTGIMHALDNVPLKMAQGEARLHRLGQTEPVTWYYPAMRDSIDELTVERVVQKMDHYRALMGRDENTALRDDLRGSTTGSSVQDLQKQYLEEMMKEYQID